MAKDKKASQKFADNKDGKESKESKERKDIKSGLENHNSANVSKGGTVETVVVTEETVELFQHQVTEWRNNEIVSDVRKLFARPANQQLYQKIVTTEILTIPRQSLVVPIRVNQQIENRTKEEIIAVPIKIQQTDVPVIETVQMIAIPQKVTKRTTQVIDGLKNETKHKVIAKEVSVQNESKGTTNDNPKEQK